MERGELTYYVGSNRLLDDVLGQKWDERIFNVNEDFAYVIGDTVKFWFGKKPCITEYKIVGNGKYLESSIEDGSRIVLTFVRGDGNRHQYHARE